MFRRQQAKMISDTVVSKPMSKRFVEDEVVDGNPKTCLVDHPMFLADVLLMSSMAMSKLDLEVCEDQNES